MILLVAVGKGTAEPWEESNGWRVRLGRTLASAPLIPSGVHPRVLYTADDLPRLRANVARNPQAAAYWRRLLDSAASGQAEPMALGLVYQMTGEEGYAAQAKEKLLALVRDPNWGQPAMDWSELYWAAPVAMRFGITYDQIYPHLSGEERREVRRAVVDRVVRPLGELARAGEGYYGWPRGNIGAHNMMHAGAAALAFVDEAPELAEEVACFAWRLLSWLNEGGIDGGWGEGVPYWQNWFIPAVRFADGLRRATGQEFDLFRHPFWNRSILFPIYMAMPGPVSLYANFGDHFGTQIIAGPTFRKLAAEYRNPYAQWFADRLDSTGVYQTPLMSLLWYDPEVPSQAPTDLPPSKAFRGIDWAVMRTGLVADDDLFLAFKGGQSDWDHHPDLGSFILNAFGERLIIDQGYAWRDEQGFSYAYSTPAHNVILVEGQGQIETGVGARGPREVVAEITDFLHSPACDVLAADVRRAYLPTVLRRFTRCVLFIRPNYFVLLDDVEAPQPARLTWLWHTFGQVVAAKGGATDRLLIHGGQEGEPWRADLGVLFLGDGPLSYTLSTYPMAGSKDPLIRPYTDTCIRLEPPGKAERKHLVTVLWPVRCAVEAGGTASINGGREVQEDSEVFARLATISHVAEGASMVARIPRGEKVDTILFQPEGEASPTAASVESDGLLCWLCRQAATGQVEAFALLDGTFLAVNGVRRIESAGGQRFTGTVGAVKEGTSATIHLTAEAELFIWAEQAPTGLTLDGRAVPGSYDRA